MCDLRSPIIPVLFHIAVETPAGLNFVFRPSYTLSIPSPNANGIIRQYGLLLLITNALLCLALADHYHDSLIVESFASVVGTATRLEDSRISALFLARLCGILSLYHIAPFWRALGRFNTPESSARAAYGGPLVIALVHGAAGACLLNVWLSV